MKPGFVLVHGYLGGPRDLEPLASALARDYGRESVIVESLPGHGGDRPPAFDAAAFERHVADAALQHAQNGRGLVLVGHSTGGSIALAATASHGLSPLAVVLAATPRAVDASYAARWQAHAPVPGPSLADIRELIRLVGRAGRRSEAARFPVLVVHGDEDDLVLPSEAPSWSEGRFDGPLSIVRVPRAAHQLFRGPAGNLVVDVARRWVADALAEPAADREGAVAALRDVEPEAVAFLETSPLSARHLSMSPSLLRLRSRPPELPSRVPWEPIFANVEVTTRCAMSCPACARSLRGVAIRDMSRTEFRSVLDLLPHAYRVTLVGLGEPLLHPQIDSLVADAALRKRRVGLVTSGSVLDLEMSRRLLEAGLTAITFSLDAGDPDLAATVRPGASLESIVANIRGFLGEAAACAGRQGGATSPVTAVFCAVSVRTAGRLQSLVELVARLGIKAIMLSDLNFEENLPLTLWQGGDEEARRGVKRAVREAFRSGSVPLSVRALEDIGLPQRHERAWLVPAAQLWQRSESHTHCASPWQTVPVAADGTVTICDCLPGEPVGNLFETPLSEIWNGRALEDHRTRMRTPEPPRACRICPRF